jgi:predicted kinase
MDPERRRELQQAAREYLEMAHELLHPPPACLVAVGGFSGSGKSTLAKALAPLIGAVPGAVVLRSDEIRKQLCGVAALDRLGPEGYRSEVTRRVYEAVVARAALVVDGGHTAIADAVFARASDREAIARVAAAARVPFVGLWLDAPEAVLVGRSEGRHLDPSDADASVIRAQLTGGAGAMTWQRLDASRDSDDVRRAAAQVLRERLQGDMVRSESAAP